MLTPATSRTRRAAACHSSIAAGIVLLALLLPGCGRRAESGPYTVRLHTIPASPETGPVHLVFDVRDSHGNAVKAKAVDVVAKIPPRPPLPEMEIRDPANEDKPGSYGVMMSLAARGTWSVGATVRDGEKVLVAQTFSVSVR